MTAPDAPRGTVTSAEWLARRSSAAPAGGRVRRKCVVIAHGVQETGRREIIALDVGEAETEAFWREFLCAGRFREGAASSMGPPDVKPRQEHR